MDATHGSARFVHPAEAGLVPASEGTAIPLGSIRGGGRWRAREVVVSLPAWPAGQNVAVLGPPRSGSSASVFVPALLSAGLQPERPSLVVSDPKGELLAIAIGHLTDAGYAVRTLAWSDPALSHGYDALGWLNPTNGRESLDYTKAQELAATLVPSTGSECDPLGLQVPRLVAAASVVLACRSGGTLADALALMYLVARDPESVLDLAQQTDRWAYAHLGILLSAMQADPRLRADLIMDLPARYQTWTQPPTLAVLHGRRPDEPVVAPEDLWSREAPVAIFIIGGREQSSQLAFWWSHLLSSLLSAQRTLEQLPRPVWLLMDKFDNIGRVPNVLAGLDVLPDAGVSTVLGLQSVAQPTAIYGRDDAAAILASTHAVLALPKLDHDSADWISKRLGYSTGLSQSVSMDGKGRGTITMTPHQRRVLHADEVSALDPSLLLVQRTGYCATLLRQRRYYTTPEWAEAAAIGNPAEPHISDVLQQLQRTPLEAPSLDAPAEQAIGRRGPG